MLSAMMERSEANLSWHFLDGQQRERLENRCEGIRLSRPLQRGSTSVHVSPRLLLIEKINGLLMEFQKKMVAQGLQTIKDALHFVGAERFPSKFV
jgi:hypothetical protein